jgi:hypothetical protein
MTTAANHPGYGNPDIGASNSPWGPAPAAATPPWPYEYNGYWHWRYTHRPLWIAATILGFIFWWPVGLALLFLSIGSRRMGCWGYSRNGGGYQGGWQGNGGPPPWAAWKDFWGGGGRRAQAAQPEPQPQQPTSGNRAFDEYRAETLRRLEEEQKDFGAFLDRLRFAKDKAEFDQFMAELRQRPPAPSPEPPYAPPHG